MKKQAEMDEAETRLLLDPYRKMGAFCNPSNHSKNKKNCEFNPNCLYGFVIIKVEYGAQHQPCSTRYWVLIQMQKNVTQIRLVDL